ncbi:MAG: GNAT family N-acetyltransferase [Gammaproteobacteria bacterium]|nr:GNAT family N-acetyltransferase [Gammaproteobacteria bacterium]|tara:strand:- start:101 stop:547 length:447 start_codon:yes stop_codon:yes gene_type:complete
MNKSELNRSPILVRQANWNSDSRLLQKIRFNVFVLEQGVKEETEWDGLDEGSWHWLALKQGEEAIGAARLLQTGQIGRMAVIQSHRSRGVGSALLESVLDKAPGLGFKSVFLHSQEHAIEFYKKFGFSVLGKKFLEADIKHIKMKKIF